MMLHVSKEEPLELLRETAAPLFVINLCASTTPVALAHPASAELKRYTFFVTRRREEGRERFRLHMGYFETLEAADAMLAIVRDVYPAAWAGPAPEGRSGTPRAAAPVAAPAAVAAVSPPPSAPAPAPAPAAAPAVAPAPVVAMPVEPPVAEPLHETMSNLREVLAGLADEPRTAPALNAVETIQLLETPAPGRKAPAASERIEVLTPEDTQTLRDIRLEAQRNAPASFAVQLVWSVQPIDMKDLPHLAIFDAYTLYNVEGNRQGRRWYGLRLGFFSDAESARQVAQYVRSEYTSVAVVPVTGKEKAGAVPPSQGTPPPRPDASKIPTVRPLDRQVKRDELAGFELLADDTPAPAKRDLEDVSRAAPKAKPAPGKRVVVRGTARPSPPGAPQVLESTLEILGASTLTIDESREIINDSAIRRARPAPAKAGRFSRLLTRLSDRVGR